MTSSVTSNKVENPQVSFKTMLVRYESKNAYPWGHELCISFPMQKEQVQYFAVGIRVYLKQEGYMANLTRCDLCEQSKTYEIHVPYDFIYFCKLYFFASDRVVRCDISWPFRGLFTYAFMRHVRVSVELSRKIQGYMKPLGREVEILNMRQKSGLRNRRAELLLQTCRKTNTQYSLTTAQCAALITVHCLLVKQIHPTISQPSPWQGGRCDLPEIFCDARRTIWDVLYWNFA